jgi:hypothetical protein
MTAPAVLGRLSLSSRAGVPELQNGVTSRSALDMEMEMTDEMLPETEWPGRTVLAVSVETRDRGLGMYSNVSENPTLFRTAGLGLG